MDTITLSGTRWYARRRASLLALLLAAGAVLLACGQPRETATPTGTVVLTVNEGQPGSPVAASPPAPNTPMPAQPPTPLPTVIPGSAMPSPVPITVPGSPQAVRAPHAPCGPSGVGDGLPSINIQTRSSRIIAVATVAQILPARWDTPDGQRPVIPQRGPFYYGIITPVLVEVEQYLKGEQPQRSLLLSVQGGMVGQDCDAPAPVDGYTMDSLGVGDRAVVFLQEPSGSVPALNGTPLWRAPFRYMVGPDSAVRVREITSFARRTIPLQQLLDEIAAAQQRP